MSDLPLFGEEDIAAVCAVMTGASPPTPARPDTLHQHACCWRLGLFLRVCCRRL